MTLVVLLVLALGLVVVASAVLAAAEVSLLRTERVSVEIADGDGDRRARTMLKLLDDLPLVLNTVLLAVLFAQVSAASIGGYLAQRWFGGAATTVAAVILTIALFVYTEAIPKTLAVGSPMRYGLVLARPVAVLVRLAGLLTKALLWFADAQTPGVGASARTAFSEDELRLLAEQSADAGEIEQADADLVHRSFEFGDTRVAEVLVRRADIVAVPESMTASEALDAALGSGHRRLPVYRNDLDSITGVVRLRDLATAAGAESPPLVGTLKRPAMRVVQDELVSDVLARMQTSGGRFAVVGDHLGRTEGLLTIEDIVAELVGEIEEPD